MVCPSCSSEHVVSELVASGVRKKCGSCGMVFPEQEARVAPAPEERVPSRRTAQAAQPRTNKAHESAAPANPVPAMKARLRWLDGEIKRLRKLEAEREQLARILSAASGKPAAVVRELRASRG